MRFLLIFVAIFLYASIGNIKEIKGDVKVLRNHKTIKAYVNMPVENKDTIYAYDNSKAKIVFKDNTIITIGKNSVFKVEDYVYGKKPKAKFSFLKGAFVSVDGKIAKIAPKRFQLKTKNASIGIRGTIVFGDISNKKDIIGCTQGLISVSKNGHEVLVKPGEMVKVFENKITPPIRIPASYLNKLVKKLSLNKKEINSFFNQKIIKQTDKKLNMKHNQKIYELRWKDYMIENPKNTMKKNNNVIDSHNENSQFIVTQHNTIINNNVQISNTNEKTSSNNGNHNGQTGSNNGNHNGQTGSMWDMMNNMMNNVHP
jgi:hypothetical protein